MTRSRNTEREKRGQTFNMILIRIPQNLKALVPNNRKRIVVSPWDTNLQKYFYIFKLWIKGKTNDVYEMYL